jgi:hypothetical protein
MPQANTDLLAGRILTVRGQRVILDSDLAKLYGVPTKRFNEAFKRNSSRFPADFAFQLTAKEFAALRIEAEVAAAGKSETKPMRSNWSQFATSSKANRRGLAYRPWVFTEHGAVMAANILRSPKAVEMSVYVVRAFIKQREALAANATILKRLAEIDKTLLEHNGALLTLWKRLQPLLAPPPELPRKELGFHTRMKRT